MGKQHREIAEDIVCEETGISVDSEEVPFFQYRVDGGTFGSIFYYAAVRTAVSGKQCSCL